MRIVVSVAMLLMLGLFQSFADVSAETVLSFYGGTSTTSDATVTLDEPGIHLEFRKVSWTGEPFVSPIYYGIRVTHWLGSSSGWGIGIDFIHAKMFAGLDDTVSVTGSRQGNPASGTERLGDTFSTLSFSHGHNVVLATGLYRWVPADEESWHSRLRPHAGFGIGVSIPHVEVSLAGSSTDEYQLSGPALQGLAGTEVVIFSRLRALLEYKFTYAHIGANLPGGSSLAVNPWTHQFTFGASAVLFR